MPKVDQEMTTNPHAPAEASAPPARAVEYLLIALAFALVVLLVDPRGDMPLNDDWNFALATWEFADTGELRFARLTGMSLRTQVLWGALWTRAFGASFEVLRASTLTLALGTLLLLYNLLARFGVGRSIRFLATFALLFHPIFFWSSFTFMTHIPFLFLTVFAFWFYSAGVTEDRSWMVGLGSLAVVASFFIRQTGVATALAAVVAIWFAGRQRRAMHLGLALAPIVLFVVLWFGTEWLLGYREQMSQHVGHLDGGLGSVFLNLSGLVISHTVMNLLFSAVFFAPLVLLAMPRLSELRRALPPLLLAAIPVAWVVSGAIALGQAIPGRRREDIFGNLRLGPQTLRDHWVFNYAYPLHLPSIFRSVFTVLAAVLALVLVYQLYLAWKRCEPGNERRRFVSRFAVISAISGTLILTASSIYFDRYSLDGLWPVAVALVLCLRPTKRNVRMATVALLVLAVFCIGAMSEYLSWNRARWQALAWLHARGVTLEQMDGGYEINQYLLGGYDGEINLEKAGMSVVDDLYIISLTDVRDYRTLTTFPYRAPLSFGTRNLYVQERIGRGFVHDFDLD